MIRHLLLPLAAATLGAFLSGCASTVSAYHGSLSFTDGQKAEARGNLVLARRDFERAHDDAVSGNLNLNAQAHALYEAARLSGYLGDYTIAERGYLEVLALMAKPAYAADTLRAPALCEYARMLRDSGQDAKAVPIFHQALYALQAVLRDDGGLDLAEFLDEAAASVAATGQSEEAARLAQQATELRQRHPGEVGRVLLWETYAAAGAASEGQSDWTHARFCWSRALASAEAENVSSAQTVVYVYELGRCEGVVGDYVHAEADLRRALAIEGERGGRTYLDLTELARLNFDQGKYRQAADYFELDLAAIAAAHGDERAPGAYVDVLAEYAASLRRLGQPQKADGVDARIAAIRAAHPVLHSNTDRTPYGKFAPAA